MYEQFGDQVQFLMVYIREAHPSDGWQTRSNVKHGIVIKQPTSLLKRAEVATQMCTKLDLSLPTVVDQLDDRVNKAYAAWPDRLYLVGRDGRIAYKSGPGPRGFRPRELELAIQQELQRTADAR